MADFQFDGCTHFPDHVLGADLTECCYAHDVAYWVQDVAKSQADLDLAQCVASAIADQGPDLAGALVGLTMLAGVTAFGWRYWRRGRRGTRKDLER